VIVILLTIIGCAAASPPARIDELAYLRDLQRRRPGLMAEHGGGVDDPAWQALVLAPEYRSTMLAQSYATYLGVLAAEYSRDERKCDEAWAADFISLMRSTPVRDRLVPHVTKDI
jgi:hypothetical protein